MAKSKVKKLMGQPPKGADALKSNIVVRVKESDKKRLDRSAKAIGTKPTALAREFILDGLDRVEKRRSRD